MGSIFWIVAGILFFSYCSLKEQSGSAVISILFILLGIGAFFFVAQLARVLTAAALYWVCISGVLGIIFLTGLKQEKVRGEALYAMSEILIFTYGLGCLLGLISMLNDETSPERALDAVTAGLSLLIVLAAVIRRKKGDPAPPDDDRSGKT